MSAVVDAVCLLAVAMCRRPHHASKHEVFLSPRLDREITEGQEDKRSEEHAFAMKKRSLWRSSGPFGSGGPLQEQNTSKSRSRLARSDIFR